MGSSAASDAVAAKTTAGRVRRGLLVAGGVLALLIAAVLGVYGWAWSATALRPMAGESR
jgi:hypothetical protein